MPIYAYRCDSCGTEKDVLQKFSDAPLTACPVCAAESFHRVLTAPAFQLKGSGWYVTDFRDGNKAKQPGSGNGGDASKPDVAGAKTEAAKSDGAKADAPAKSTASPAASGGSAPAGSTAD
ncbi:MAG: FmdB family transcriptional regulator [Burkholderiales bacterium]|jgi:putative FmdB family regulatory protein|nr:MAG: FmdB family transcriptional regulator [Burkholderiales bacterium]